MNVINELQSLQDLKYRDFQSKLIPNVDKSTIIGVRMPDLRKLAKKIDEKQAQIFMEDLPHTYYEENMLQSILISNMKNYDDCIDHLERFLPFVDNWAVSDCISPKTFTKNTDKLIEKIKLWAKSPHTYTVRVAICLLMKYFLDEKFKVEYLKIATRIRSEEYYVNMMVAWFFATALAKQWDDVIFVLEDNLLDEWTHNKTIQKARESFRITPEQKQYLKSLKKRR
ncbi:DNA alkylation repair protein [Finegoldia magna ALB8]|uniref:DNA alkylation repair protein n=1 Tax=Finegoldia magna TaxID=1260 RepID=UPI0004485326|nr:DNA alkylation repair protein [Finegoldia magna]EXF26769.1 DNA alkylation repair protein [Finegoldia magna ALB8]